MLHIDTELYGMIYENDINDRNGINDIDINDNKFECYCGLCRTCNSIFRNIISFFVYMCIFFKRIFKLETKNN